MSAPFGSTVIPALGMTFAEGAAKVLDLFREHEASAKATPDDWPDHLVVEACAIRKAMFASPPQTADDALAVVSVLAHREDEVIVGEAGALERVRDCMATLTKGCNAITLSGAGVGNADTLPAGSKEAAPLQPPYPPKLLAGVGGAGALIVWREAPSAPPLPHSPYTVLDCTIVGPFFLDVIQSDEPEDPKAPFSWAVCRLLHNGFSAKGNATSLEAGKAAAEDAVRCLLAGETDQPTPVEPGAPLSHAGAVEAFRDGHEGALVAWGDYTNDDRLEADTAVLAERFRLALADVGPVIAIGDALALARLQHELVEDAVTPDGWPLYGARASMVAVISEALGEMARRALHPASATPGTPSAPSAASK